MTIIPNIHFTGQCKSAIELYERAFGAQARGVWDYPKGRDYGEEITGLVYHAEICIGDIRLTMSDSVEPTAPVGNTVSLMLGMGSAQEARLAYAIIEEGATVITPPCETDYSYFFASLIDRYGVRWELIVEK